MAHPSTVPTTPRRSRRPAVAGAALAALAAGLSPARPAEAAPIQVYGLTARVTDVAVVSGRGATPLLRAVRPGVDIAGAFVKQPRGRDGDRDPDRGFYEFGSFENGFALRRRRVEDAVSLDDLSAGELTVVNDHRRFGDIFNYLVADGGLNRFFEITLVDRSGRAFDGDELPRTLRAAAFDAGEVSYTYVNTFGGFQEEFVARVTGLERVPFAAAAAASADGGGGAAVVTPVPAGLPLLAAGLGGLAWLRARHRRRRAA